MTNPASSDFPNLPTEPKFIAGIADGYSHDIWIPVGILQAWVALRRDFPRLLAEHDREWVGYHGVEFFGCSESDLELHAEAQRRGYKDEDVLIIGIEPDTLKFDPNYPANEL